MVDSNIATIAVTIRPVNDAPVANPARIAANEDLPVSGKLAGHDLDGDKLTCGGKTLNQPGKGYGTRYQAHPSHLGVRSQRERSIFNVYMPVMLGVNWTISYVLSQLKEPAIKVVPR